MMSSFIKDNKQQAKNNRHPVRALLFDKGNTNLHLSWALNLGLNIVMQLTRPSEGKMIFFNFKNIKARFMPMLDRIVLKMKTLHENTP